MLFSVVENEEMLNDLHRLRETIEWIKNEIPSGPKIKSKVKRLEVERDRVQKQLDIPCGRVKSRKSSRKNHRKKNRKN